MKTCKKSNYVAPLSRQIDLAFRAPVAFSAAVQGEDIIVINPDFDFEG